MKAIIIAILTISTFTSCKHLQFTKIDYHQMSLDYEKTLSNVEISPIEEKLMNNKVLFFTTCLEELLHVKVIEVYDIQSDNSFVLADSKEAYIMNRNDWQDQNQIKSDAILSDCGTYNCDVEAIKFLTEETRIRIQLLENILNSQ